MAAAPTKLYLSAALQSGTLKKIPSSCPEQALKTGIPLKGFPQSRRLSGTARITRISGRRPGTHENLRISANPISTGVSRPKTSTLIVADCLL